MRAVRSLVTSALLAIAGALPVYAQATWTVTLGRDAAGSITRTGPDAASVVSDQTVAVEITCDPSVDCRKAEGRVTLQDGSDLLNRPLASTGESATGVTLTLTRVDARPVGNQQRFLQLTAEGTRLEAFPLKLDTGASANGPSKTIPLSELLTTTCAEVKPKGDTYDQKRDAANFIVTPLGQVLARPGDVIDEGDSIVVTVTGAEQLLARLTVSRSSEFGVSGGIRIVGAEIRVAELTTVRRQAAGQPHPCNTRVVTLHDFAPGRGEVQISVRTDEGEEQLGKFEFGVNPLYTGAFSFGIVRSALADPTFGLLFNGTDSIVTERENPTRNDDDPPEEQGILERERILYGVFYTPFFGRVDIEKSPLIFRPTVGFALNDIADNVFVGGTLLIQGSLSVMGGVHLGKVTRLDPGSSLDVGSVFEGSTQEIPTTRRWRGDLFLGVGLDLRAAAQFLKTAFGSASG